MSYTIPDLNKDTTEVIARWHEMKQSKMDESLAEMVKIWTTLSRSQKEALMREATRASQLNQEIDRLVATRTAHLKAKEAKESGKQ